MNDPRHDAACRGGAEVGVAWIAGGVLHEEDPAWHAWDPAIYGEVTDRA